jgi:N-acetyl-gamma-glutamyl-phosphate reductase
MIRVAVIGATGYTGGELLKLLVSHPEARVNHVTSSSRVGQNLSDIHPFLRNRLDLPLESFDAKRLAQACDVAFFALPHGVGSKNIADFVAQGKRAVDLSADFRLKDVKTYEAWYKVRHASPALLKKAVYGLPELYRKEIRKAPLIANPGCYATTTILALTPLLRRKWVVPGSVVVDAKSGVSGAGRKVDPMYLYCEVTENFQAYAVAKHRHVPEIEQVLADQSGSKTSLTFVPHLAPMTRGILVTAYGTLKKKMTPAAVRQAFEEDYEGERFLRILPEGRWPQTKDTAGTNYVDINVTIDERNRRVVVLAALDNLVKGASGQAVQNMNLLFGLSEAQGIK